MDPLLESLPTVPVPVVWTFCDMTWPLSSPLHFSFQSPNSVCVCGRMTSKLGGRYQKDVNYVGGRGVCRGEYFMWTCGDITIDVQWCAGSKWNCNCGKGIVQMESRNMQPYMRYLKMPDFHEYFHVVIASMKVIFYLILEKGLTAYSTRLHARATSKLC